MKELTYLAGSAIKITASLNIATATCTVTIKDEFGRVKIDNATMTKIVDGIYEYIYQSAITDEEANYTAIVKIVSTSGTSYEKIEFYMEEQP
jgi:hypothetical protein